MNTRLKYFSTSLLAMVALLVGASPAAAQSFAVLGEAAVTCTNGDIVGDVGTNQATPTGAVTVTGCPTGTVHVGDAAAKQAFAAFQSRYAALTPKLGDTCTTLSGTLAGRRLAPGVYCFPAAAALAGVLTLNGPSNGTWIFKIGSTLATSPAAPTGALTGTGFTVVMAGAGQACNVTWWVAEASTMTDSNLKGTILAGAAITETGGTLNGSIFSKAGVTITGTAVTGCAALPPAPVPGKCSSKDKKHDCDKSDKGERDHDGNDHDDEDDDKDHKKHGDDDKDRGETKKPYGGDKKRS
jgi:hypothetical protein